MPEKVDATSAVVVVAITLCPFAWQKIDNHMQKTPKGITMKALVVQFLATYGAGEKDVKYQELQPSRIYCVETVVGA